jgi:ABC-2 type transport system ATP-binding protein
MTPTPAITFEAVRRTFGRRVALDSFDLTIPEGTVVGLVGRNGAGKTTALRLAHGYLHPDSGRIRVLGLDPVRDGLAVRREVSLLSEEAALYPWMTVGEILRFAGGLHPRWDHRLAEDLRDRLDLDPNAKLRTLSRGSRAKVSLVLAVAPRPRVLLLDDPTAGLDPLVRREVLQGIIETIPDEGGAVVYASHLIQDIERIVDRVVVLDEGRVTLGGTIDELRDRIRRAHAVFPDSPPRDAALPGALVVQATGRALTIVAEAPNGSLEKALREMGATTVEVETLDLEEILVACLKGHADRDREIKR